MAEAYPASLLRSLRNDIPIARVIEHLSLPAKLSEGYLRFCCPCCGEFNTATKTSTNLARCFSCQRNFNPIDLVMTVTRLSFVDTVEYLLQLRLDISNSQTVNSR